MTKPLLTIFLLLASFFGYAQSYETVSYNLNGTPANAMKIKTNLPYTNSSQMVNIKIEGYCYGAAAAVGLNIVYYIYNDAFVNHSVSSWGAYAPDIYLSNESGLVCITLADKPYFPRFKVSVFGKGMPAETAANFTGWTVVDEVAAGTNITLFPYKNVVRNLTVKATGSTDGSLIANGNSSIGPNTLSNVSLAVNKNISGATSTVGVYSLGAIQSDVTGSSLLFGTLASTQAANFNLLGLHHYRATQGTFGAGSTVANQYGFFVDATLVGATNNYAFSGNIPAGGGRYNLFMSGTAQNYLNGPTSIGTGSALSAQLSTVPASDAIKGIVVKAFSPTQSASLFETQNSAGAVVAQISPTGNLSGTGLTLNGIPVTSASGYDLLTRNTATGQVEKVNSDALNQTLSLGTLAGNLTLGGTNNVSLTSLNLGAAYTGDANASGLYSTAGFYPYFNGSASTNYPTNGGSGFRIIPVGGTTGRLFEMWVNSSADSTIYARKGIGSGTYSAWMPLATKFGSIQNNTSATPQTAGFFINGNAKVGTKIIVSPTGNTYTTDSGVSETGPGVYLSRSFTTGSTNEHGFMDRTTWGRTSLAYNSYDAQPILTGMTMDHYDSFQARPNIQNAIDEIRGHSFIPRLNASGSVNNMYAFKTYAPTGSAAVNVTNNYGLYIQTMGSGTANRLAIYTESDSSHFGGIVKTYAGVDARNGSGYFVDGKGALSNDGSTSLGINKTSSTRDIKFYTGSDGANYKMYLTNGGTLKIKPLTASDNLNLAYDDTNTTTFKTSSAGNLTITPSGGQVNISGNMAANTFKISNTPITSAGAYDVLTRNTVNGSIEKVAASALNVSWAGISGKPTTLTGYGITDGATSSSVTAVQASVTSLDGNAVHKAGTETITGRKHFDGGVAMGLANGVVYPTAYKLAVGGGIIAESVKVKPQGEWPDYVFEKGYPMLSLLDLEKFILKNKHLPNVPSAAEVKKEGLDLGETNAKLLQKIEELTLYLIEKDKEIQKLSEKDKEIKLLSDRVKELSEDIKAIKNKLNP